MALTGLNRTSAEALLGESMGTAVIASARTKSVALSTLPVKHMTAGTARVAVQNKAPVAKWVADQGKKPVLDMGFDKLILTAEEIAGIVVVSESVIADADNDVVKELEAELGAAIARGIDAAVFFGTDAPATFPTGGLFGKTPAGNKVAATANIATDLNTMIGAVEGTGGEVDRLYSGAKLRGILRGQMVAGKGSLYDPAGGAPNLDSVWGIPLARPLMWDKSKADVIGLDSSTVRIGLRQDVTFKILDQATVGGINLAEQDSIGIRVVARVGFVIGSPAYDDQTGAAQIGAVTPKAP